MKIIYSTYMNRLLKSFLISLGCMFVYIVSNQLMSSIFIPSPHEFTFISISFLFLSYVITIFFVSLLFEKLSLSKSARMISLFFYFLFLTGGIQSLIHYVFQTGILVESVLIVSIIISITSSYLLTICFPHNHQYSEPYLTQLINYFKRRSAIDWSVRLLCGGFFLFITYYLMNSMIFPFIEPYYDHSSRQFLMYHENFETIKMTAMITHSAIMILAFLPLFALWKGSKSSLLFWFGFPLFIIVALQPFILYFQWPLGFRFPILVQMTLIMYIQAIILVQIFYLPLKTGEENSYSKSYWSLNDYS